jgi:hypothetical protein
VPGAVAVAELAGVQVLGMFRFTLRDILWLMVIIGFCLHAWTERFSRDVAWRRRVNEEVLERVQAQERAKVAEERANRYARIMWELQVDLIWARNALWAADRSPHSATTDPQPDSTASAPSRAFSGSAR